MPRGEFDDVINFDIPQPHVGFDSLWDQDTKPKNRRWNRTLNASVDADMYEAVQNLVASNKLPFGGSVGDFLRHAVANNIEALRDFLDKDTKILWSVLQATQRRLTAERYVVTAEEQVKAAVELLETWSAAREWQAIANDLTFHTSQIKQLPQASWRRRVANEWMISQAMVEMMALWASDMADEDATSYNTVQGLWAEMFWLAEKG